MKTPNREEWMPGMDQHAAETEWLTPHHQHKSNQAGFVFVQGGSACTCIPGANITTGLWPRPGNTLNLGVRPLHTGRMPNATAWLSRVRTSANLVPTHHVYWS